MTNTEGVAFLEDALMHLWGADAPLDAFITLHNAKESVLAEQTRAFIVPHKPLLLGYS